MLSRQRLHQASAFARPLLRGKPLCLCAVLRSLSRQQQTAAYSTSTQREAGSPSIPPDSLFSQHNSPWDKIFEDIDKSKPLYTGKPRGGPSSHSTPTGQQSKPRSHSMTAREKNVFQEMFDIVFNAAGVVKGTDSQSNVQMFTPADGVGTTPQSRELADLFSRLQKNVKRMRWTSEIDEELDRKKEEIELCDTDVQLLDWATSEVFKSQQPSDTSSQAQVATLHSNQLYPHLIAALMRAFRDKFRDPHLALAIFDHAKNLSIYSYVFGCTAPAYNELIETQWFCFRDLKGTLDTLEEMKVNGIEADNRTRRIVETIRRNAPTMGLLEEEDYFGNGQDRVMHILTQIELLVRGASSPIRSTAVERKTPSEKSWSESWKYGVDEKFRKTKDDEDWSWGRWGSPIHPRHLSSE
ncbi:hypothetical protein BJ322DRAFT_1146191 [Thelephora terrestris]|uniref:Mtf2-like C-terminal domain-containing protein n=1 Tax=Thelephora terrestris TaxID=56493 RepID=A0A9P6H8E4_9AGAM|nr:hypothetical protein BJ322DRAFT_1146191 [Thelephora terrestris]